MRPCTPSRPKPIRRNANAAGFSSGYAAIYAAVVSLICSGDGVQRPVGTHGNFLYDLRMAGWKVGEAMAAEITKNMVIVFTVAWIALPILSWAIWRYASRRRNRRRLRVSAIK
jgi:hypothetical protein